jgi:uncharacterized protein YjiS (DUF1127 family)
MSTTTFGTGPRPAVKASAVRSSPAWLAGAMKRLIGWMAKKRRSRRDTHALAALNERQLADIGLRRGDVVQMSPRESLGTTWKLR